MKEGDWKSPPQRGDLMGARRVLGQLPGRWPPPPAVDTRPRAGLPETRPQSHEAGTRATVGVTVTGQNLRPVRSARRQDRGRPREERRAQSLERDRFPEGVGSQRGHRQPSNGNRVSHRGPRELQTAGGRDGASARGPGRGPAVTGDGDAGVRCGVTGRRAGRWTGRGGGGRGSRGVVIRRRWPESRGDSGGEGGVRRNLGAEASSVSVGGLTATTQPRGP